MGGGRARGVVLAAATAALLTAAPATAYDPAQDAANRAKSAEREKEHGTDEYQAELRTRSAKNAADGAEILASDPDRAAGGAAQRGAPDEPGRGGASLRAAAR